MGYVTRNVPLDHPDFGKAFPCECRHAEQAERTYRRLLKLSNLESYIHLRFDNFKLDMPYLNATQRETLSFVFSVAQQFADDPQDNWLVIEGSYGSGKTHLAAAIGNDLVDRNRDVMFMTVPDLLDHLRTTFSPTSEIQYDQLFNAVKSAQILILDDLGTEAPSDWVAEKLFQLLNHRYVNRMPTVITTNHQIEEMDGRVASRLQDRRFVWRYSLNLPDFRSAHEDFQEDVTDRRLYQSLQFGSFEAYNDSLRQIKFAAHQFSQAPQGWFILTGNSGTGKTHLAAAIANVCHQTGRECVFLTIADLLDRLRATFNSKKDTFSTRFEQIRETPLLVLDAFRIQSASAWAAEKLFQLIDHRYLAQKPTVITISRHEIENLDERLRSRFADGRLCQVWQIEAPGYYTRTKGTNPNRGNPQWG